MNYKFKYYLKLGKDLKMLMNTYKTNGGLVVKTALFHLVNGEWLMLNRPTEAKIQLRNHQFYFRRRLPKNYKSVHSELFYIDEFTEIRE